MPKDTIRVIVGERKFDFPKSKIDELNDWLLGKAKLVIEPKEDLVIDIEETQGASIKNKESEEIKKNETRSKKSNK